MFDTMPTTIVPVDNRENQNLIAPVQDNLVAKQAYAVGDVFIFNNGLYDVTSAIAQGGNIIIGTNAVASTSTVYEKTRNGLTKATGANTSAKWVNAYTNAKSYIVAIITGNGIPIGGTTYRVSGSIVVPKDIPDGTRQYFESGAGYTNFLLLFQLDITTTNAVTVAALNGTQYPNTTEFYYD